MPPRREVARPGSPTRTGQLLQDQPTPKQTVSVRDSAITGEDLDQSLPNRWQSPLEYGIREKERPDRRKVWNTFVSIAMSAQRRGWSRIRFIEHVTQQTHHKYRRTDKFPVRRRRNNGLWRQLCEFSRDDARALHYLDTAWDQARLNLADAVEKIGAELSNEAVEFAWSWDDRLASECDDLTKVERGVMDYLVTWTERRGRIDITCDCRSVGAHVGIGKSHALNLLKSLAARGLLIKHSAGTSRSWKDRHGEQHVSGRAAIYSLAPLSTPSPKVDLVKSPGMSKSTVGGWAEVDHH